MARKRNKGYDKSVYRSLVLVTQFGINMLVPICIMSALGIYLDKKSGASFWMVLFFFLGAIAGGQNVFRLAKKIYDVPKQETTKGKRIEREQSSNESDRSSKTEK